MAQGATVKGETRFAFGLDDSDTIPTWMSEVRSLALTSWDQHHPLEHIS